jgi:NADPH:quinone reductase-like Zn-dependent oxidoreductase
VEAWELADGFGIDHLRRVERPEATPAPGEVVVDLAAASLNYRDLLMVQGAYDPRQPLPLVPCSDGAGTVTAVGPGVERVAVGDRVCPLFAPRWLGGEPTRERLRTTLGGPLDGTLQRRLTIAAEGVVRLPEEIPDREAACLPCAALTAWSALVTHGQVGPGDTVLVLGTGGVALFALQIARLLGARVFVTSSSDARLERARELGAEQGINYRQDPAWGRTARRLAGQGVDHVVELGGAPTLEQSLEAVRIGGTVSLIGNVAGNRAELSVVPAFMKQVRLQGVLVGHRDAFERMLAAFAAHRVRPVVDTVVPFAEAPQAFARLGRGGAFGKVVVADR